MSRRPWHIPRRTFLRGAGATLALPLLEAMAPTRAFAQSERPRRLVFVFVPNGKHMPAWTPSQEGAEFELPATLQPLAGFKEQMLVLSGLTLDKARANGDGPGDHARAVAAFLTGSQPRKTAGKDIRVGVSVDQVAARKLGHATRFASLELGCDRSRLSGSCDSGYSCAYSSNLSWRSASSPNAKEINPRRVFDRLFGEETARPLSPEERDKRRRYRRSILDLVRGDAQALHGRLGRTDRGKLDEYLTGIRELERRLERSETEPDEDEPDMERPAGVPRDRKEHIKLMYDLLVLALQTDSTRIATFLVANAGSNRSYRDLGVKEGHHSLSHHGKDEKKREKIARIDKYHTELLAYFLERMKTTQDGEGSLLDNSLVLYGSGIGDGNRHNHHELPILLAGSGGGSVSTGRHVRYPRDTPLTNLYLALLHRMNVRVSTFGDSTGVLGGLSA